MRLAHSLEIYVLKCKNETTQLNERKNLETTLKQRQNLKRFTDRTRAHTYVTGTSYLEISEIFICSSKTSFLLALSRGPLISFLVNLSDL